MIARILFYVCWDIVWCIKTNFLFKYCMQWLKEYCFLHVGTFCDASKRIFFWSLVCNDCKNTVFNMLEHCVMHQNEFSFEVLYAMITRILFSACWNILWCIKTNFLLKYWMDGWIYLLLHKALLFYSRSIVCNDCKNSTILCILEHCVMHQNKFSF